MKNYKFYIFLILDILYIVFISEVRVIVETYCRENMSQIITVFLMIEYIVFGILAVFTVKEKQQIMFRLKSEKVFYLVLLSIVGILALYPLSTIEPTGFFYWLFANTHLSVFMYYKEIFMFDILFPILLISDNKK